MSKIFVILNNKSIVVEKGTSINELTKNYNAESQIVGAIVNNKIRDLNYCVNDKAIINFIDLCSRQGIKIYERSLLFVLIKAVKDILPDYQFSVEHSLGGGIYCELKNNNVLTKKYINKIRSRMKEIINENISFKKTILDKDEAMKLLEKSGDYEKLRLSYFVEDKKIQLYELDGYFSYFYGQMLPSTGYIDLFEIKNYYPGLVVLYPSSEDPKRVRKFNEQRKLFHVFSDYERWGDYLEVYDVASLNKKIQNGTINDLIKVAEAYHEKIISKIADEIYDNRNRLRIILIAGPSSAGKTTTSKRIRTHLMVNGLKPITIGLDDYFLDRELTPKDENGDYDFENIDAIDIELFNDHLLKLMEGKEVEIPVFNFMEGKREYTGKKMKVNSNNPIIIEGIHGLNDKLTRDIPRENKYKIYINALTQLNIDLHNRVPTTDTRLIRRLVRDNLYRGHSALSTLKMWKSVKKGEQKYIFPFQEEADFIFNSALFYELAVLKKYVEPLLLEVTQESEFYPEAERLLNFLDFFLPIENENSILTNSVLREFIGGSIYREEN